jgi:hypothetical protein
MVQITDSDLMAIVWFIFDYNNILQILNMQPVNKKSEQFAKKYWTSIFDNKLFINCVCSIYFISLSSASYQNLFTVHFKIYGKILVISIDHHLSFVIFNLFHLLIKTCDLNVQQSFDITSDLLLFCFKNLISNLIHFWFEKNIW